MAALVLADGADFDVDAFRDFLTEQPDLGPKQWPSFVRVARELPRTESFKVIKRQLAGGGHRLRRRGVADPAVTVARVGYREFPPPPHLRDLVECAWVVDGPPAPVRVLPDGCMDLIRMAGRVVVAGPDTTAFVSPRSRETFVGLRFRPGTLPRLLGVPAAELRNGRVALADLGVRVAHGPFTGRVGHRAGFRRARDRDGAVVAAAAASHHRSPRRRRCRGR